MLLIRQIDYMEVGMRIQEIYEKFPFPVQFCCEFNITLKIKPAIKNVILCWILILPLLNALWCYWRERLEQNLLNISLRTQGLGSVAISANFGPKLDIKLIS